MKKLILFVSALMVSSVAVAETVPTLPIGNQEPLPAAALLPMPEQGPDGPIRDVARWPSNPFDFPSVATMSPFPPVEKPLDRAVNLCAFGFSGCGSVAVSHDPGDVDVYDDLSRTAAPIEVRDPEILAGSVTITITWTWA